MLLKEIFHETPYSEEIGLELIIKYWQNLIRDLHRAYPDQEITTTCDSDNNALTHDATIAIDGRYFLAILGNVFYGGAPETYKENATDLKGARLVKQFREKVEALPDYQKLLTKVITNKLLKA